MNREKIATIFIGLLIGALLAGGYFVGSKFLLNSNQSPANFRKSQVPLKPNPGQIEKLIIYLPDDNISTSVAIVKVSGKTPTDSNIILFANADEKVASPDADNNFSADLDLEVGENEITMTAIDQTGKILDTVKRSVILEPSL